jgi:hypothetical protein
MSDIELVIRTSKAIETILVARYGASGRGLHEKISSIQYKFDESLVKQIRYLATSRNNLLHADGADFEAQAFRKTAWQVFKRLDSRVAEFKNRLHGLIGFGFLVRFFEFLGAQVKFTRQMRKNSDFMLGLILVASFACLYFVFVAVSGKLDTLWSLLAAAVSAILVARVLVNFGQFIVSVVALLIVSSLVINALKSGKFVKEENPKQKQFSTEPKNSSSHRAKRESQ